MNAAERHNMSNTDYMPKQPGEHRLTPNMLRVLGGNRALADQVIAEVEDSLWLAEKFAAAQVEAWDEGFENPNQSNPYRVSA